MSEATRAIALQEAVKWASPTAGDVLEIARSFNNFLEGGDAPVAAAPAKVEKAAKPPKVSKPAPEPEPEPSGPTKEDVGKAVEKMLAANKRSEAVNLMKKHGAVSVSSLNEGKYAAFLEDADAILMAS